MTTATILPGATYLANPDRRGATHIEQWNGRAWFIYDLGNPNHRDPWITFASTRPVDMYAVLSDGRVRAVSAEQWAQISKASTRAPARYVLKHVALAWPEVEGVTR